MQGANFLVFDNQAMSEMHSIIGIFFGVIGLVVLLLLLGRDSKKAHEFPRGPISCNKCFGLGRKKVRSIPGLFPDNECPDCDGSGIKKYPKV